MLGLAARGCASAHVAQFAAAAVAIGAHSAFFAPSGLRMMSHLPRTRSVEQESTDNPPRSPDAPRDPMQKMFRDTKGVEDVDKEVHETIVQTSGRAPEALQGRADRLHEDPAHHMNLSDRGAPGESKFGNWAESMVGDGTEETVKTGVKRAKQTLEKMFGHKNGDQQKPEEAERSK